MATIYQCDRCGHQQKDALRTVVLPSNVFPANHRLHWELCRRCLEALFTWLHLPGIPTKETAAEADRPRTSPAAPQSAPSA